MYRIDIEDIAKEQIRALPEHLLPELASLFALLELQPWSGPPMDARRPSGNIRRHDLGEGGECSVVYLVLDDQKLVLLLRLVWV
ncbi:hypothetical protein KIK06_02975 [Nocardiopsis sp. EMB25]|uniref:hypothetical protein n=1 Tax=Nocardiopsis TaxID=2013 RepID=UPI000348C9A5|nr:MULTISPECIES: hypothetical protein [Nocardiopsis]MCY9782850.1 hypothetical protein [Nocardiopsis sp. EMB25]